MTDNIWLSLDALIADREARRARERKEQETEGERKRQAAQAFAEAFNAYRLTDEDREAIMRKIAKAFADGEKDLMLFSFPSELCSDGGRRINHRLEGWEESLPGAARRVFEFWRDDLQQRGFLFSAAIISYPDGMPGDVGVFFSWPKEVEV